MGLPGGAYQVGAITELRPNLIGTLTRLMFAPSITTCYNPLQHLYIAAARKLAADLQD